MNRNDALLRFDLLEEFLQRVDVAMPTGMHGFEGRITCESLFHTLVEGDWRILIQITIPHGVVDRLVLISIELGHKVPEVRVVPYQHTETFPFHQIQ